MTEMTSESFNGTEYHVIGQYMSPVSDAYQKKGLATSEHRVAMCELAVNSTAIMVDPWEANQTKYTPTKLVLDHFESELVKVLGKRPHIYLICGSDLLNSFNTPGLWAEDDMNDILENYGIVCLQRNGADNKKIVETNAIMKSHSHNIRLVDQWTLDPTSSTELRNALMQGKSIRFLTPDPVLEYIKQHKLWITP